MNIYQQELLRKMRPLDCTGEYDEDSEKLNVQYEGVLLCKQDKDGYLSYDSRSFTSAMCDKLEVIKEQAAAIREYVDLYENAPPMKIDSLKEYRKFAEYGDTVLGGMYSKQNGFTFSTWKQDKCNASFAYSVNMLKLLLSLEVITKEEFDKIIRISAAHYGTERICV